MAGKRSVSAASAAVAPAYTKKVNKQQPAARDVRRRVAWRARWQAATWWRLRSTGSAYATKEGAAHTSNAKYSANSIAANAATAWQRHQRKAENGKAASGNVQVNRPVAGRRLSPKIKEQQHHKLAFGGSGECLKEQGEHPPNQTRA